MPNGFSGYLLNQVHVHWLMRHGIAPVNAGLHFRQIEYHRIPEVYIAVIAGNERVLSNTKVKAILPPLDRVRLNAAKFRIFCGSVTAIYKCSAVLWWEPNKCVP